MPHHHGILKERLGDLALEPRREEEIVCELSEHLEDEAAALEARGVTPKDAVQKALDSVSDWPALRSEIVRAETGGTNMNYRTKVLWLPALGAFILSSSVLAVFQSAGLVPRFIWLSDRMSMGLYYTFYTPWLALLPVVGAVVALWSQLVGGRAIHRLLAALAPAVGMLGVFLIGPFIGLLIYALLPLFPHEVAHRPALNLHAPPIAGVTAMLVSWVLLPGAGLVIGAVPFLRKTQRQA